MQVRDLVVVQETTDRTITTTTERVAASSGPAKCPFQTVRVLIMAWLQVTTGAATTTLTARIRRGTAITGTLVGQAIAEQVKAAAGSTEQMSIMVTEDRAGEESVEYSVSVEQASATGDGTIVQATIVVIVL